MIGKDSLAVKDLIVTTPGDYFPAWPHSWWLYAKRSYDTSGHFTDILLDTMMATGFHIYNFPAASTDRNNYYCTAIKNPGYLAVSEVIGYQTPATFALPPPSYGLATFFSEKIGEPVALSNSSDPRDGVNLSSHVSAFYPSIDLMGQTYQDVYEIVWENKQVNGKYVYYDATGKIYYAKNIGFVFQTAILLNDHGVQKHDTSGYIRLISYKINRP